MSVEKALTGHHDDDDEADDKDKQNDSEYDYRHMLKWEQDLNCIEKVCDTWTFTELKSA